MTTGSYITINEDEIDRLIKEVLGFDLYIDLGPTGRTYPSPWDTERPARQVAEQAEFALWDVSDRANVLSDDDLTDAAIYGIRQWLKVNKDELQRKINKAAEDMKQDMLAEPKD